MKRSPLIRRVPLRTGPRKDPVTPEVRRFVLARDGSCLAYQLDPRHICRDQWGRSHAPTARAKLTLDHVHDGYGLMGVRAPSDPAHLVTLCHAANVGGPSKELRQFERDYLAGLPR